MADFFSDLGSGIRLPATQINQGSNPLPGSPYTSFDGQINAGSELLGGITPYGGAKGLPMGSDRNYQHIPHRSQQIIPPLYLPHADLKEPRKVKVIAVRGRSSISAGETVNAATSSSAAASRV